MEHNKASLDTLYIFEFIQALRVFVFRSASFLLLLVLLLLFRTWRRIRLQQLQEQQQQ